MPIEDSVETTIDWEIDGTPVLHPDDAEAFVNATPARRADITARIVAHVRAAVSAALGPKLAGKVTAMFQNDEEAVMLKIFGPPRALEDIEDILGDMEFEIDGHRVKAKFEDITSGGRRKKFSRKTKKAKKATRRRRSTRRH